MTAPETVLEEVRIQMTLRQALERAPLRPKYRPLALDGVGADALFADTSLAMSDLAVILDFAQQSVTAPGVGVYCNGVRHMEKGRRQQTLVSCGVPQTRVLQAGLCLGSRHYNKHLLLRQMFVGH